MTRLVLRTVTCILKLEVVGVCSARTLVPCNKTDVASSSIRDDGVKEFTLKIPSFSIRLHGVTSNKTITFSVSVSTVNIKASHRGGPGSIPFGPCRICVGQNGTRTGFSPNTSVFPCQFHSTGAPLKRKSRKKKSS
jgi:hypothetical protein